MFIYGVIDNLYQKIALFQNWNYFFSSYVLLDQVQYMCMYVSYSLLLSCVVPQELTYINHVPHDFYDMVRTRVYNINFIYVIL